MFVKQTSPGFLSDTPLKTVCCVLFLADPDRYRPVSRLPSGCIYFRQTRIGIDWYPRFLRVVSISGRPDRLTGIQASSGLYLFLADPDRYRPVSRLPSGCIYFRQTRTGIDRYPGFLRVVSISGRPGPVPTGIQASFGLYLFLSDPDRYRPVSRLPSGCIYFWQTRIDIDRYPGYLRVVSISGRPGPVSTGIQASFGLYLFPADPDRYRPVSRLPSGSPLDRTSQGKPAYRSIPNRV